MNIEMKDGEGNILYPKTKKSLLYTDENRTTNLSTHLQSAIDAFLDQLYPIGTILYTATATNPSTYYGGEWVQWGGGRVVVGVGVYEDINGDELEDTETAENSFGKYSVYLTTDNLPPHQHKNGTGSNRRSSGSAGSDIGNANNNNADGVTNAHPVVPYGRDAGTIEPLNNTVPVLAKYIWKRTE